MHAGCAARTACGGPAVTDDGISMVCVMPGNGGKTINEENQNRMHDGAE